MWALDFIRDFTGWTMVCFMGLWFTQRRDWIIILSNGMRLDAYAVQQMCAAMIVSILFWQVIWNDIGAATIDTAQFVVFSIVMRAWLATSAMMAVIGYWRTTRGWTYERCLWQALGWVGVAGFLTLIF